MGSSPSHVLEFTEGTPWSETNRGARFNSARLEIYADELRWSMTYKFEVLPAPKGFLLS